MQYNRAVTIRIVVLILLVVLYFLQIMYEEVQRNSDAKIFSWLARDEAERSTLLYIENYNKEQILLQRNNNVWYLRKGQELFPAKQAVVLDLLGILSSRSVYSSAADSEAAAERLGLDEETASRIIVYGKQNEAPLLDLCVGINDHSANRVYVRRANSSHIYQTADVYTSFLTSGENIYLDLSLFPSDSASFDADDVQRVLIEHRRKDGFALQRSSGNEWFFHDAVYQKLDQTAVRSYIGFLSRLEADAIASDATSFDYDMRITLELGDLSTRSLFVSFDRINGLYPIWTKDSDTIFLMNESGLERLAVNRSFFVSSSAFSFLPDMPYTAQGHF